jgi:hypothetical protein
MRLSEPRARACGPAEGRRHFGSARIANLEGWDRTLDLVRLLAPTEACQGGHGKERNRCVDPEAHWKTPVRAAFAGLPLPSSRLASRAPKGSRTPARRFQSRHRPHPRGLPGHVSAGMCLIHGGAQSPAVTDADSSCSCAVLRGRPRSRRARATPIPARMATAKKADLKPSVNATSGFASVFAAR